MGRAKRRIKNVIQTEINQQKILHDDNVIDVMRRASLKTDFFHKIFFHTKTEPGTAFNSGSRVPVFSVFLFYLFLVFAQYFHAFS